MKSSTITGSSANQIENENEIDKVDLGFDLHKVVE